MVLRCVTCGAQNPATNLYCGQCGTKLHRDTPEHETREPSGVETEVEARAKEEAERKRRTEIARWKEIELESRGIFMPWNIKDAASNAASEPARDAGNDRAVVDAASEARASLPPDRPNVLAGGERVGGQNAVRTGAPSYLGLADKVAAQQHHGKRAIEFLSERNIALVLVAAALILVTVQWSSLRDNVAHYVQNNVRRARGQDLPAVAPPALAPDNTSGAPVQEPPAVAVQPEVRTGANAPPAHSGNASAPGSGEMYQAAHATDAKLRVAWLWKAVRTGNPQASVELAKMYAEGDGVAQSCDQARILLTAAAAKGNEQANQDLQQLQLRGGCTEQ
jgi:hypothetical protein